MNNDQDASGIFPRVGAEGEIFDLTLVNVDLTGGEQVGSVVHRRMAGSTGGLESEGFTIYGWIQPMK